MEPKAASFVQATPFGDPTKGGSMSICWNVPTKLVSRLTCANRWAKSAHEKRFRWVWLKTLRARVTQVLVFASIHLWVPFLGFQETHTEPLKPKSLRGRQGTAKQRKTSKSFDLATGNQQKTMEATTKKQKGKT